MKKKVIIIGASSGIGKSLAEKFAAEGAEVGISARRFHLLEDMNKNGQFVIAQMDVSHPEETLATLHEMIRNMGGLDVLVINAGILNHEGTWQGDLKTATVNSNGFMVLAHEAYTFFSKQGHGQILALGSIAGLKGFAENPAYCASKAFLSTYLQGLAQKAKTQKLAIHVSTIIAGFVTSDMTAKRKIKFWTCSSERAAKLIYNGAKKRKRTIYVSRRWRIVAALLWLTPNFVFERIPVPLEDTYYD